jgi:prepilin-type N-terminal cleavage/methylation domain-containing protein
MARRREIGFTLIELMIVVTIIGVLAVVAGTAYRRYMDNGRTTEAYAMLAEIRNKEEAYRAEYSTYAGWSGGSEASSNGLPKVDSDPCSTGGSAEPCPKSIGTAGSWLKWAGLGINPGKSALQCGYVLNTNLDGTAGTLGTAILNGSTATPWWYAVAICDNDGKSTTNATFTTASTTSSISAQNEHQ